MLPEMHAESAICNTNNNNTVALESTVHDKDDIK
jgi:hypothetical protein